MAEEPDLGQNPLASLSTSDALRQLGELDNEITLVERQGAIATQSFIELLQKRRQLCEVLKKFTEMNNCDTRIKFLEARIRGDIPAKIDGVISLDQVRRKKKRNPMIALGVTFVIAMTCMLASIPIIKSVIDGKHGSAPGGYAGGPSKTAAPGSVVELNEGDPGREFDITRYLKSGHTTVFYFHSEYCPPCEAFMPQYTDLAANCGDISFYTLDLNRAGTRGIDFDSPLARQYSVRSIPFIVIYDGYHKIASGRDSFAKLTEYANR